MLWQYLKSSRSFSIAISVHNLDRKVSIMKAGTHLAISSRQSVHFDNASTRTFKRLDLATLQYQKNWITHIANCNLLRVDIVQTLQLLWKKSAKKVTVTCLRLQTCLCRGMARNSLNLCQKKMFSTFYSSGLYWQRGVHGSRQQAHSTIVIHLHQKVCTGTHFHSTNFFPPTHSCLFSKPCYFYARLCMSSFGHVHDCLQSFNLS